MAHKSTFLAASLGSLLLAGGVLAAGPARADVIFTGTGTVASNSASASADFAISGLTLTITLTNTSSKNDLESPGSTLSGLSFTLPGDPALKPVSAISPGAIVDSAGCDVTSCTGTNVNVGGEWGYQNAFSYATGTGSAEGIASSGYLTTGLSGDIGNFNNGAAGTNLAKPASLDGINFGILSNKAGPLNGGLSVPLLQDSVVLTLKLPTGSNIKESDIGSVTFLYGTSLGEGSIDGKPPPTPVPEPGSLALLGTALAGLGVLGFAVRRRRAAD